MKNFIFTGVLINAGLVIAGSAIGLLFKGEKLKRIGERIFQIFAIFVMVMGVSGAMDMSRPVLELGCIIVGVAIGELLDVDKQFNRLGNWIQKKLGGAKSGLLSRGNFSEGFVNASLLFCIGSMTFLGAMESGIEHQHTIYITKGILDGISAITLAMGSGIGVAFSSLAVFVYQGLLTVLANLIAPVLTPETVAMCVSIGSLSLVAIGFNILEIKKIKVANFLPAMFMPMVWQAIMLLFK